MENRDKFITISVEEFCSIINTYHILGTGHFANVYLLNKDEVMRLKRGTFSKVAPLHSQCYNSSLPNVLFPIKYVFCNDKIIGYTAKYFKGKNLDNIEINSMGNITIEHFYSAINTLYNQIVNITRKKLYMIDISIDNTLCKIENNKPEFCLIDTDFWITSAIPYLKLLKENIASFNIVLLEFMKLIESVYQVKIDDFINNYNLSLPLLSQIVDKDISVNLVLYFTYLRNSLEDIKQIKINTIDDFYKSI